MKELLNLEYNQKIIIEKQKYTVIAMLKFIEGSSYWLEYILKNDESSENFFLDVEPVGKIALHKMVNREIKPELVIIYEDEVYNLFQKGNAKIQTYYGYSDVGLKDEVEYYEYIHDNKLFTIEKWKNVTEVSSGKYVDKRNIKVLKVKNEEFRL